MWGKHILIVSLVYAVVAATNDQKSYDDYRMIAAPARNMKMARSEEITSTYLNAINLGLSGQENIFLVPKNVENYIIQAFLGWNFTVLHEDVGKFLATERKTPNCRSRRLTWDDYYEIDVINKYLIDTNRKYPDITELIQGGRSYENRRILGLRILTSTELSNFNNTKPAAVIEAGIHAREWITTATATYLIEKLLTSRDPRIIRMRDTLDWHIFPSVNPDGYQYTFTNDRFWRKTRSRSPNGCYGADPNRNWDHNWGLVGASKNPCHKEIYAGSKVFSEVETKTFSEYLSQIEDLRLYLGVHSYAQTILLPYSDSVRHQNNYDDLVTIGKTSIAYGARVNGVRYSGPGTAAKILYPVSGGSMDWVKEKLGTDLVFTYELRGRAFSWPKERIPEQGEELVHMLRGLIDKATELGYL